MKLDHFPRGVHTNQGASKFPDASWWDNHELIDHDKWTYKEGDIFVGNAVGNPVGVADDRHLLTVAGSRSGKGRQVIIPNMCLYPGSIVAIDPKGDLATITAARRGQGSEHCEGLGQPIYVLDPFEVSKGNAASYRARFNPLDTIEPNGPHGRDDAALLSDALIIPSTQETHWTDAAKMLLTGLILHVCADYSGEDRTLITVREMLTADLDRFTEVLAEMSLSETAGGVVRRTANALISMAEKERSSVISTASVQTDFLDSPAMRDVLSRSDFTLSDLKRTPSTVYLSLPAGRMGTHSRWLRLMIALTIEAMERDRHKPDHAVLLIMDEFHALGPMQVIERAAGLMAGFGVRLWPILQDLTQLQRDYPKSWETFLGNAGLTQWFGINDLTTLDYLSKRLGQTTLETFSQSEITPEQRGLGYTGQSRSHVQVPLMTAEEIGRYFSRQSDYQLVLWPGTDPIALGRVKYDASNFFKGKLDPDPNYPAIEADDGSST